MTYAAGFPGLFMGVRMKNGITFGERNESSYVESTTDT